MTTATIAAISAAASVKDVVFADTIAAVSTIREVGDHYSSAAGVFFKTAAAASLFLGDADARAAARSIWADSKDKSREYFLKVCRACVAAGAAGNADKVADVATFSQLQALGKVVKDASDKDDKDGKDASDKVAAAVNAAKLFDAAKQAGEQVGALNRAAGALETLTAQAIKMSKAAEGDGDIEAAVDLAASLADPETFKKATKAEMAAAMRALMTLALERGDALAAGAAVVTEQVAAIREIIANVETAPVEAPAVEAPALAA